MLHDRPWHARCDRCLVSSQIWKDIPREEVEAKLRELGWELRDDRQTWCLRCSREAREVQFRPSSRGVMPRRGRGRRAR